MATPPAAPSYVERNSRLRGFQSPLPVEKSDHTPSHFDRAVDTSEREQLSRTDLPTNPATQGGRTAKADRPAPRPCLLKPQAIDSLGRAPDGQNRKDPESAPLNT